ncbi:hypothetical protein ADK38_05545 [Streptomyces varsoviensis]|uniref:Uncharacterized protein n=1 Tax=Streptomyces varsoviensis TaxID=67373 RepID=A0ABR5JC29_9ACTN|nr:hypothetical protein ADK38_05545 [Streptomyces varsoviensis]
MRWSRFPPVVAALRSCPDAPASRACDSAGYRARTRGCAARSLLRTFAPTDRPPSGVGVTSVSGSPETSTSSPGAATPSFIRSTRFVPPPR